MKLTYIGPYMYTETKKEQEISFVSSKWYNSYHRWTLWSICTVHMFQQVKDYKTSNMPFSQLNMIKRKQKLISEVICINHNFSHEFKDDVKWVLYSEHYYRTLERLVLKLTITQVLVTPKKKPQKTLELISCSCFWE